MTGRGLFGQEVEYARTSTRADGYAWTPGTGPPGETCATCRHLAAVHFARTYWKCALVRERWTGGRLTDVLKRSPACRFWEKGRSDGNPCLEVYGR